MPASMREAQAQDWLADLREFGPQCVEEACKRWRRQPGGRRPTPGDIRALCIEEQQAYGTGQKALPAPDTMSEEAIHAAADSWARARGFDCIEAVQRAGYSVTLRLPNGELRYFEGLPRKMPAPRLADVPGFQKSRVLPAVALGEADRLMAELDERMSR